MGLLKLMDVKDQNSLYLLSYLISKAEDERIVGVALLATRLYYLTHTLTLATSSGDFTDEFSTLVTKSEDEGLDWSRLKTFLDQVWDNQNARMFIQIRTDQLGVDDENKWTYEFTSRAPTTILEDQLELLVNNPDRFFQKVEEAAQLEEDELFNKVYYQ